MKHNPYPVDSSGVTVGAGIPAADLDRLIAATIQPPADDEPFTSRDAMFPDGMVTVRIATGEMLAPRAFVSIGVVGADDGEDANVGVLLDGGTAIVMALDLIHAAAQVMRVDPGPFYRMTRADMDAADVALYARRNAAESG